MWSLERVIFSTRQDGDDEAKTPVDGAPSFRINDLAANSATEAPETAWEEPGVGLRAAFLARYELTTTFLAPLRYPTSGWG